MKYLDEPDATVVHITFVKEEVAAPVEGAAAVAEPEVIKKGKTEVAPEAAKETKKK